MTTQQHVDGNGIMSVEELIDAVADRVIARLTERQRPRVLRMREVMLAGLRAHEDMYGLPRSIPTLREQGRKDGYLPKEREEE